MMRSRAWPSFAAVGRACFEERPTEGHLGGAWELGKAPKGNKSDLVLQLQALIEGKKGHGASDADVILEMKRSVEAAAAARQVNDRPVAMAETGVAMI